METVKGYVEHIVFRNEDNGYTVFNLNNDDGDLTCVGNFNYLSEGELIEVNGEYVVHSVYGTQLRVLNYEIKAPEDLLSIGTLCAEDDSYQQFKRVAIVQFRFGYGHGRLKIFNEIGRASCRERV